MSVTLVTPAPHQATSRPENLVTLVTQAKTRDPNSEKTVTLVTAAKKVGDLWCEANDLADNPEDVEVRYEPCG